MNSHIHSKGYSPKGKLIYHNLKELLLKRIGNHDPMFNIMERFCGQLIASGNPASWKRKRTNTAKDVEGIAADISQTAGNAEGNDVPAGG